MPQSRSRKNIVFALVVGLAVTAIWLYGLFRNLSVAFDGDSLGYVSRARNISIFGLMNHELIEVYGVPLQSMGYSVLLSLLPDAILFDDAALLVFVSIFQVAIYVAVSAYLASIIFVQTLRSKNILFYGLLLFWPGVLMSTQIMADSISLSLQLLIFALAIKIAFSKERNLLSIFVAALFGALVIIRPSSITILGVILLALLYENQKLKFDKSLVSRGFVMLMISLVVVSPQVIWTYQQFDKVSLLEYDDSYTEGVPILTMAQNSRATFIQLNGCTPSVDCNLVSRHPGPFSYRSFEILGSDYPTWSSWVIKDPLFASLQAGLILLASLDQEFFFTYLKDPALESSYLTLSIMIFMLVVGIRSIALDFRSNSTHVRVISVLALAALVPHLATQTFLFHAENRYGLFASGILFFYGLQNWRDEKAFYRSKRDTILIVVLTLVLTQISWRVFVLPLT